MPDRDDPLAHTATAAGAAAAQPAPDAPATLGRFRLERELGRGGMGVVHVAFDPDLERRIALKVLRTAGDDAARRLQREARAMARLTHPNVVTVHEVGTASGRDFVAMELIDGASLADWLRAERRDPRAIVDAFVAAGRGLAAAHAAGIVHRDFKPHNILRSRAGRIAVTDFGLARAADGAAADPLAVTLPVAASPDDAGGATATPSGSLAGLTVTGSVLGTPAYMAPEQWRGEAVTAATDQFAFCVALWEALADARPFPGPGPQELARQVEAGARGLPRGRIPRRLHPLLVRGLEPAPARRWPSMDALLAAIERAQRRSWAARAGLAAALVGGVAAALIASRPAPASCPLPAVPAATVWTPAAAAAARARGQGSLADLLDRDLARWGEVRARACALPPARRGAVLDCLDGALAHLGAVVEAAAQVGDARASALDSALVDPAVCELARTPRLVAPAPPTRALVLAAVARAELAGPGELADAARALAPQVEGEPCARAVTRLLGAGRAPEPERRRALEAAATDGERCEDERIRADLAIGAAVVLWQSDPTGGGLAGAVARADAAVARVAQPDLVASVDRLRGALALRAEELDAAIAHHERAVAGYAARGGLTGEVSLGLELLTLLQQRARPADLARVEPLLADWTARVRASFGAAHVLAGALEVASAEWAFQEGDVAGAHARLRALHQPRPLARPVRVHGRVLDAEGRPVAGAEVAAAARLVGDGVGAVVVPRDRGPDLRFARTGPDGRFELPEAVERGLIVAEQGALRAPAQRIPAGGGEVTLRLAPTSRLEGKVALGDLPAMRVTVAAAADGDPDVALDYVVIAPVAPDGSFVLEGAPRGAVRVLTLLHAGVSSGLGVLPVEVAAPVVTGLLVPLPASGRRVSVLVRSTVGAPVPNAQVFVQPGRVPSQSLRAFVDAMGTQNTRLATQLDVDGVPAAARAAGAPGDLVATFDAVPEGEASACALGLPGDLSPALNDTIRDHLDALEVRCAPIAPDATLITVEVPPWPRLPDGR